MRRHERGRKPLVPLPTPQISWPTLDVRRQFPRPSSVAVANLAAMSVAAGSDESEDEDSQPELTEEQRAKLRKSMDLLSSVVLPMDQKLQNLICPPL